MAGGEVGQAEEPVEIDDALFSRQRYALGDRGMRAIVRSGVLLVGCGPVGMEVGKNLVLAGVGRVGLVDGEPLRARDVAGMPFSCGEAVGRSRAAVALEHLSCLNPYSSVSVALGDVVSSLVDQKHDFWQSWQSVVLCEQPLRIALAVSAAARARGIPVVLADMFGPCAVTFVDTGPSPFEVVDPTGESPREAFVVQQQDGVFSTLEPHGFQAGMLVKFAEMSEDESFPVHEVLSPQSFSVKGWNEARSGQCLEVKQPRKVQSLGLDESLVKPEFEMLDLGHPDRPCLLLLVYRALHAVREGGQGCDVSAFLAKLLQFEPALAQSEIDLAERAFVLACGVFPPASAALGGIAAQEVMKCISALWMPVHQWLCFDWLDVAPPVLPELPADAAGMGTREAVAHCIGGERALAHFAEANLLMVGAGAVGCELLKNFALCGLCQGSADAAGDSESPTPTTRKGSGMLCVVDDDVIEESNLTRQFLFRRAHIRQPKAVVACEAVRVIDPKLNALAFHMRVHEATEGTFGDSVMAAQDVLVSAVDSVQARMYLDRRSLRACVPLVDSGTLGSKGHVQIVVPHVTEPYGAVADQSVAEIPYCTLRSFPFKSDHAVEWARDRFERDFVNSAAEVRRFVREPGWIEEQLDQSGGSAVLRRVAKKIRSRPRSYEDCMRWAFLRGVKWFNSDILQLLYNFPPGLVTADGLQFWSPPKRCPTALAATEPATPLGSLLKDFVDAASVIYAEVWGVAVPQAARRLDEVARFLETAQSPSFVPKEGRKIIVDESATKDSVASTKAQQTDDMDIDESALVALRVELETMRTELGEGFRVEPAVFEKDFDANRHIDFIAAAAGLRARNYSLPVLDRLEAKRLAGNIAPAIVTTTSVVAAFETAELLKVLLLQLRTHPGSVKVLGNSAPGDPDSVRSVLRNGFFNLAAPQFTLSEPGMPARRLVDASKHEGVSFTVWDRWVIDAVPANSLTLRQLQAMFLQDGGGGFAHPPMQLKGIMYGSAMIYIAAMKAHKRRLGQRLSRLLEPHHTAEIRAALERAEGAAAAAPVIAAVTITFVDPSNPAQELSAPAIHIRLA